MLVKFVFDRFAPLNSVSYVVAFANVAPERFELLRFELFRLTFERVAFEKFTFDKFRPERSVPDKLAPAQFGAHCGIAAPADEIHTEPRASRPSAPVTNAARTTRTVDEPAVCPRLNIVLAPFLKIRTNLFELNECFIRF